MMKKFKVLIYRQSYDKPYHSLDIYKKDIEEYMKIPCHECESGLFYITDNDFFECVECKGTGVKWVNMYWYIVFLSVRFEYYSDWTNRISREECLKVSEFSFEWEWDVTTDYNYLAALDDYKIYYYDKNGEKYNVEIKYE